MSFCLFVPAHSSFLLFFYLPSPAFQSVCGPPPRTFSLSLFLSRFSISSPPPPSPTLPLSPFSVYFCLSLSLPLSSSFTLPVPVYVCSPLSIHHDRQVSTGFTGHNLAVDTRPSLQRQVCAEPASRRQADVLMGVSCEQSNSHATMQFPTQACI